MRRRFIRHCVAALAICVGGVTSGMAAGGAFTRGCAARDMQVIMLIEASAISPQERTDAVHTIMHARIMCFEGHVVDALKIYDKIAQRVASGFALSGQGPGH